MPVTPASECRERARVWAAEDTRLSAVFVYGSVARGLDNESSDLDIVLVARRGERERLWEERATIAERLLNSPAVWAQELPWQRPYRYQAWRDDLAMVDLSFDEERAAPWHGLAEGFEVVADRDGVASRLRDELACWQPPEFDAERFDGTAWPWLWYLAGRLQRGAYWFVRAGLYDTLNTRVVHLLGAAPYDAEHRLRDDDLAALRDAAPRSSDPAELRRALQATVALYDRALDRWAERTGRERPRHPLAPAIRKRIAALDRDNS